MVTRTFGIVGIAILISGITGISIRGVEMLTAGIVGITMFRRDKTPDIAGVPGTAVGDLQQLDKNQDLYSDFDVLDDLQVEQDQTANP